MPSMGELMRMPFHVTWVCEGDVPRKATVERVARPYCLTKIEVLKVSTSAIERAIFSCSATVSSLVCCMPISFIGRRAVIPTSPIGTTNEGLSFHQPLPRDCCFCCPRAVAAQAKMSVQSNNFFIPGDPFPLSPRPASCGRGLNWGLLVAAPSRRAAYEGGLQVSHGVRVYLQQNEPGMIPTVNLSSCFPSEE